MCGAYGLGLLRYGPSARGLLLHLLNCWPSLGGLCLDVLHCTDHYTTTTTTPISTTTSTEAKRIKFANLQAPLASLNLSLSYFFAKPLGAHIVTWWANRFIQRRTRLIKDLSIDVKSRSNRQIVKGKVPTIRASFSKCELENVNVSNTYLEITGLDLKLLTLLINRRLNVLRSPCELFGDFWFTIEDLRSSPVFRNLVQRLANLIITGVFKENASLIYTLSLGTSAFVDHIDIRSVKVQRGKMVIEGDVIALKNVIAIASRLCWTYQKTFFPCNS